jgi:hypothetical protein
VSIKEPYSERIRIRGRVGLFRFVGSLLDLRVGDDGKRKRNFVGKGIVLVEEFHN